MQVSIYPCQELTEEETEKRKLKKQTHRGAGLQLTRQGQKTSKQQQQRLQRRWRRANGRRQSQR